MEQFDITLSLDKLDFIANLMVIQIEGTQIWTCSLCGGYSLEDSDPLRHTSTCPLTGLFLKLTANDQNAR